MPAPLFSAAVFAAAFGGYLLLAGSLTATEAGAGFGAACLTSAFVTARRSRQGRPVALPLPPARVLVHAASALLTDTVRVAAALARALARPVSGRAGWQPFRPGGVAPSDAGRRALVTVLASAAPNGIVLDIRPSGRTEADHAMLVHRLAPAPPPSGRDWPA